MPTWTGMNITSVATATRLAGPSCWYSSATDPMMRRGDDMRPRIFWKSICSVSVSEVTCRQKLNAVGFGMQLNPVSLGSCRWRIVL